MGEPVRQLLFPQQGGMAGRREGPAKQDFLRTVEIDLRDSQRQMVRGFPSSAGWRSLKL